MQTHLTFQDWKKEVERVTRTLICRQPDEVDDLPYWDLWNRRVNPYKLGTYVSLLHNSTNNTISLTSLITEVSDTVMTSMITNIHMIIQDMSDNRAPV